MIMSERARNLAERLEAFNRELITFVDHLTEEQWRKVCAWEDWGVGVTARHIGAGHYEGTVWLAKNIVNGDKLPELTGEQIDQMANQHAREHVDCTKAEVLEVLRKSGDMLVAFAAGLADSDLDRTGYLAAIGREVSAQQLIETVVLQSGGEHFANLKAAAVA
jgi:hypothetical protein